MNLTPDAVHAGEAEDPDDSPAASSREDRSASLAVPAPGGPGGEILVRLWLFSAGMKKFLKISPSRIFS